MKPRPKWLLPKPDAAQDATATGTPKSEPIEFGKPLSDAERDSGRIGGGQPGATFGHDPARETALANARVDAERARNGLPPLMEAARRANPEVWDRAMERLAADANVSARLVDELTTSPRATTVDENALLLHRKIALSNEYERSIREENAAYMRKDKLEADRLRVRTDDLLGQIDALDQVTKTTGTEWGRAGQFRRQLAREDFSLSRMMGDAQRAKREPLTPEERQQIEDLHNRIEELERQLAELKKDGGKTDDGKDSTDIEVEIDRQKRKYKDKINQWDRSHKSPWWKAKDAVVQTSGAIRSFITAFDLSAVLRQGGILTAGNPRTGLRAVPDMLKSLWDSHHYERVEKLLRSRPNADLYKESGLYLSDNLSAQEEAFAGRWVKKIPGVAASERAYTSYLNRLRADVFDSMVRGLSRNRVPSAAEAKAIANFINVATGRGKLGAFEHAAKGLAQIFFSPRYAVSRFQMLAGEPFYGGTMRTRGAIAAQLGSSLAGVAVFYAIMRAFNDDAKITFNPRSSDFGKVVMGDFRLDPLAGLSQAAVLVSRLTLGETQSSTTGQVKELKGEDYARVIARFLRSKLAPVPGALADIRSGESATGEKVTAAREVGQVAVPLSVRDVYESMVAQGLPRGAALAMLAILGMGTQNYDRK